MEHKEDLRWIYATLSALLLFVVVYQSRLWVDLARDLENRYIAIPVFTASWPKISGMRQEARAAGIHVDDTLVAIDGELPSGMKDVARLVRMHVRDESVHLQVRRGQELMDFDINVVPVRDRTIPIAVAFAIVIWIVKPALCIGLGFWVAAARPRDIRAWILLGVLVGFSQLASPANIDVWDWSAAFRIPAIIFRQSSIPLWSISMMLFGLYFPETDRFEERHPRLKWLLIGPLAILGAVRIIRALGVSEGVGFLNWVQPYSLLQASAEVILNSIAICIFFLALAFRAHDRRLDSDGKRRLRLLKWGATISLTPLFLLIVWSLLSGSQVQDGFGLVLAVAMLFLFPLTLAYVIVVERALDVRVVVRQGIQYALASGGVRLLQLLVSAAVVLAAYYAGSRPFAGVRAQFIVIIAGAAAVLGLQWAATRLRAWVDRRFFREQYDAEKLLGDLSEEVRTIIETAPVIETVARRIAGSLHVERLAMLLDANGIYQPAFTLGYGGHLEASFTDRSGVVEELHRTRQALSVYARDRNSWLHRAGIFEDERGALERLDTQVLLPLTARDRLLGFISLGPRKSEAPYSSADLRLLRTVAAQTALALEISRLAAAVAVEAAKRERIGREIEIAREVQERLFPQTKPQIRGLDYAGHCKPAQGVGGDYYDFLELPGGSLGIAVADISGKGIPAALLMASLQASLRGQIGRGDDIASLVGMVNRLVYQASPSERYATFFYAQYDPATKMLQYVNGGHNPPLLLRGAETLRLETGGPVVGLFPWSSYEPGLIRLEKGDRLILFTDGVCEAMNSANEEWSEERLESTVRQSRQPGATTVIQEVFAAADRFAAGAPQHDDMTMVVIHVTE